MWIKSQCVVWDINLEILMCINSNNWKVKIYWWRKDRSLSILLIKIALNTITCKRKESYFKMDDGNSEFRTLKHSRRSFNAIYSWQSIRICMKRCKHSFEFHSMLAKISVRMTAHECNAHIKVSAATYGILKVDIVLEPSWLDLT